MILFLSRCRYGCYRSSMKKILKNYNLMFFVYAQTGFIDKLREKQPFESQIYQNDVTFSFGYRFR